MYKIKIKTTWADCDANAHVNILPLANLLHTVV